MSEIISIIIPTYNEKDNIIPLIKRIDNALGSYNYEIVFVDDNSEDGTASLITSLSTDYPVSVVVRQEKSGLASAVVDGLGYVSGQIIGVMDADLQHPPELLPELVWKIENKADIAIASRYVKGGGCQGWGLTRRTISKGAIFIAHLLLPLTRNVKDPMSGFFAFEKDGIIGINLQPIGYKILLEMLVVGRFKNVAEVAYVFRTRNRGESKLSIRQQFEYLKHIYTLMKRKGELLRLVKFCLVGLSGVFVNIGLLWLLTDIVGLFYLISAAISIESSIITNFILNNLFTFYDRTSPVPNSFSSRLMKFNFIALVGLGLNIGVLWLFTEVFGIYYLVSEMGGIVAATLWNYVLSTWWVWK